MRILDLPVLDSYYEAQIRQCNWVSYFLLLLTNPEFTEFFVVSTVSSSRSWMERDMASAFVISEGYTITSIIIIVIIGDADSEAFEWGLVGCQWGNRMWWSTFA